MGPDRSRLGIDTARPLVVMITSAAQIWISRALPIKKAEPDSVT